MKKAFIVSLKGNGIIIDGTFTAEITGTVSQSQLHNHYVETQEPFVAEKIRACGKMIVFTEIKGHC